MILLCDPLTTAGLLLPDIPLS